MFRCVVVIVVLMVVAGVPIPWQSGRIQMNPQVKVHEFVMDTYTRDDPYIIVRVTFEPSPEFSLVYMEVSNGSTVQTNLTLEQMASKLIDTQGFVLRKNQTVYIQKPLSGEFRHISIVANTQPRMQPIFYQISISTSAVKPCPNHCSAVPYACLPTGQCQCPLQLAGKDCSINPKRLSNSLTNIMSVSAGDMLFVKVSPAQITLEQTLIIYTPTPTNNTLRVYFNRNTPLPMQMAIPMQMPGPLPPVSPFNYIDNYTLDANNTQNIQYRVTPGAVGDLWILILNTQGERCTVAIQVLRQGELSLATILQISFGLITIVVAILIPVYFIRKKRLENATIHPSPTENPNQLNKLPSDEFERYFPSFYPRMLAKPSQLTKDYLEFNQIICAICLCEVKLDQPAKLTYCYHKFHKECLSHWFELNQSCPTCRQSLSKNRVKEMFRNVYNYFRKKHNSSIPKSDLEDNKLITAIHEFSRQHQSGIRQLTTHSYISEAHSIENAQVTLISAC